MYCRDLGVLMANFTVSANMGLSIPTVSVAPGPTWATLLDSCLTVIDAHTHNSGSGVQITSSGLNINADLTVGSNNLTSIRSSRFTAQASPLALTTDLGCVYVSGVDLYYNDISGNQVRITQSGAVAGTPGSIANLVSPASASWVSASSSFVWQSAANTSAYMDCSSIIMRNLTASSNALTLQAPTLSSNYSITLPALPASDALMTIASTGIITSSTANLAALNPVGAILAFGGVSAPTGYLACDGSAVSRSTYAALFTAISTAYGTGNGTTTFNLPDLRGQFLRGVSGTSSNDPDKTSRTASGTGGNTGNNVGSAQTSTYASHSHVQTGVQSTLAAGNRAVLGAISSGPGNSADSTVASGGNETRPINIYVLYIIKT